MRVYIPVRVDDLAACVAGDWEPAHGFALTPTMLEISALDDDDELAEQVRDVAAAASAQALGSALRAVVVVDVSRADVSTPPGEHPAAVSLSTRVGVDDIACLFVDELEASGDVARLRDGDDSAWEALESRDLLWWDASEVDQIPTP